MQTSTQTPADVSAPEPGSDAGAASAPARVKRQPLPLLLLKAMRPKQWTKNGLLFAGLIFSLEFTDPVSVARAIIGFALFCIYSSSVYIMNDVRDREKDKLNARTRNRPIASGALSPAVAIAAVAIMLPIALVLGYLLNPWFFVVAVVYLAKDVGYSFGLKNVVILDVFLIAIGFTLRAAAGALAIPVDISPWLYVVTTLGALFLALNKRKHEVLLLGENAASHRSVLGEYSPALIDEMLSVVTASTIMAYSLYTFTAENLPHKLRDNHLMMLTIPFAIYGIFRYLYLVYQRNEGSSPEEALFRDRPLLICVVLWGLTAAGLLYYFH